MDNKRCSRTALLAALTFGFGISFSALAGEPSPGSVQETLEEPPEPPVEEQTEPEIERQKDRSAPVDRGGREVRVNDFRVTGNQALSDEQLDTVLAEYEGGSYTLFEIFEIADELTAYYRDRGYGLASVTVPAQKVDSGTVHFEIIEGRVARINVEGHQALDFEFVENQLDRVRPGEILHTDTLESELLLLGDMPGIEARSVVSPGDEYGTSNLLIKIEEDRYTYGASVDNYGRESIGELRLTGEAAGHTLLANGDRLALTAVESESGLLSYGQLAYGLPVGNSGGRLRASFGYADYEVGGPIFGPLAIAGTNRNLRVEYTHPFVRLRDFNLVGGAALKRTDTEVTTLNQIARETELDLLEFNGYLNQVFDGGSFYSLLFTFSGNFKDYDRPQNVLFGAEPRDDQKGKYRLDGRYTWRFAPRWAMKTRFTGVWSPEPLVDTEKFSLGGPYSVRAFVPAEARGDRGTYTYAGVERRFTVAGMRLPVAVFVDHGYVKRLPLSDLQEQLINGGSIDDTDELSSAGFSVGLKSDSWYEAELIWATNIGNYEPAGGDDSQLWARFTASF